MAPSFAGPMMPAMSASGGPHGRCFYGVCNSQVPLTRPVSADGQMPAGASSVSMARPVPPVPVDTRRSAIRKIAPSTVSWESPKWFRVPGVPRSQPDWKPPKKRHPLKHASAISADTPEFVQHRSTEHGKAVMEQRTAERPSIYEIELSRGQVLRGIDRHTGSPREVGDPRKHTISIVDALHDPNVVNAHGAEWHSASRQNVDLGTLFEKHNVNLIEAFKTFDADGSGSITTQEFKDGLQQLQENHLISELSDQQVDQLVSQVDQDGSGEIEYAEFHQQYHANQAAGALVRRHMYGSSGETETINIRGRNNRKIGVASDFLDSAARNKPNFHPGHAEHVDEHHRLSGSASFSSSFASGTGGDNDGDGARSPSLDGRSHTATPVFGKKLGYGGKLSELALSHKTLLPVQHNQERTTLRRTSSSLSDSAARLKPMLHSDSVYNVTSEPTLVSSGIIPNVERHSGSIASQRRGRANSPVLATMLSADGMRGSHPGVRAPARPASVDELKKTRVPYSIANYTNEARKRMIKIQPRPWIPTQKHTGFGSVSAH